MATCTAQHHLFLCSFRVRRSRMTTRVSGWQDASYFNNNDRFNHNYAQAKATAGSYKEAEEIFVLIQSEKIKNDYTCLWLARCCEYYRQL
ncbi:intraflagellar transport protein 56-like isoform X1 [Patiria miniata]|uniref:Uncharacterized protein n=1 Tax=Patiria miniata TaxID=46514 RepID=A0A914B1I9_PATMI|nr:intraflagellar transport protein 56-like isoform X1 [Patiria miniata]